MSYLAGRRILVTGGAGFLGRQVCRALSEYGPASLVVPRSAEYDLRKQDVVRRLLAKERPELIIHLAAVVGGIGANQRNPGRYFYNIGSGQEITIRQLAEMICELCGFRGELRWQADKPDGQPRRCVETRRAEQELGFTASTSLPDGLAETIAWYRRHRHGL